MATLEDFSRLEMRVGKIIKVEDVEGARKPLFKLTVEFGGEMGTRTIVAGIKSSYTSEQLLGKKIACVVNLDPKMVAGVESQGMLLATGEAEGISLLAPDRETPEGSRIG